MKIVAMIPARMGSQRLPKKNLQLLGKDTVIEDAILRAKKSKIFDEIYVNSENLEFKNFANKHNVNFFHRNSDLATSTSLSDDVVFDFLSKINTDIVVWLNSINPLLYPNRIFEIVNDFKNSNYVSAFTITEYHKHFILDDKPVNFNINIKFERTQDLTPLSFLNYGLMMWKKENFISKFQKNKNAFIIEPYKFYKTNEIEGLSIKYDYDLILINCLKELLEKKDI